jgi:polar amino acid transport system permease protein
MAEVFRSGIQAVPAGQREAGQSLGMSRRLLMRRIVLPQAFRIVIPAIGNFFVSIFKDSALVSVITMRDLMFTGELLASATFKHFEIFGMVAIIYFCISYPVAKLVEYIESHFDVQRRALASARQLAATKPSTLAPAGRTG